MRGLSSLLLNNLHGWNHRNHLIGGLTEVDTSSTRARRYQQTTKQAPAAAAAPATWTGTVNINGGVGGGEDQTTVSTKKRSALTKKTSIPVPSTTQRKNLPPIETFLPKILALGQQ
eukprot:g4539.t1